MKPTKKKTQKNSAEPKTAVIYARYSSENQREESIEGQIRECTAYAEKNGYTVLHSYIDRAMSGKTDRRPEFQRMIDDGSKKLFDTILVWKLDRFARNRKDSNHYKGLLKVDGITVVSATEHISRDAAGVLLESVLEGLAEYFSVDLAEKVIRGETENALKCKFNGGNIPLGYVIDSEQYYQLDELKAPFVQEAFTRYAGGATMREIQNYFNEKSVKNNRGKPVDYNAIRRMLQNRRYLGEYRYRDIVTPGGIPAIVSQELFDAVQRRLEKNEEAPARYKAKEEYLLSTKMFCGYCGASMIGDSGTSHNGTTHRYYKCSDIKNKRKNCDKETVRKEEIEDIVIQYTMDMLNDDNAVEDIITMILEELNRENVILPMLEKQLQEAEKGIENVLNAIQAGAFTPSTKERLVALEAAKEELKIKIANEKLEKPQVSREFLTYWLHKFRRLDVRKESHRKTLIDIFVNSIYLFNDKMLLNFNYREGTKTITFSDIKAAQNQKNIGSVIHSLDVPKKRLT